MTRIWRAAAPAGLVLAMVLSPRLFAARAADPSPVAKAFADYFGASDRAGASKRIEGVIGSGVTFDDALARLRRGRDYAAGVPKGQQQGRQRTFDGVDHDYAFVVPSDYTPTKPYQLRVQLHGGVGRDAPPNPNRLGVGRLPGTADEIEVFPTAWSQSLWWQASQVDNLERILDKLKRIYNVDENRVYLTGVSDGGTGVYYMAFRDTTPWASFLPLIGHMMVLSSPEVRADGQIYPGNAVNKPLFIVNAGRDRLYPAQVVRPYVAHLAHLGADLVFHEKVDSDHSTAWWPEEQPAFEAFVEDHPRDPLPDKISWEIERTDRYNRAHWLVIDRLGDVNGQANFPDGNLLPRGFEYDFGIRMDKDADRGRRVSTVLPDSNAFQLGVRPGDSIVQVDGQAVQSAIEILQHMQRWETGRAVRITVERAGHRYGLEGPFQPAEVESPPEVMFSRVKPSGRVDLKRRGNVIEASTHGVRAFTLLLSPSKFDLARPIRVVANGRTVFEGTVEPSVATLMKWAAVDNDRTMLFGAELSVDLTPSK